MITVHNSQCTIIHSSFITLTYAVTLCQQQNIFVNDGGKISLSLIPFNNIMMLRVYSVVILTYYVQTYETRANSLVMNQITVAVLFR